MVRCRRPIDPASGEIATNVDVKAVGKSSVSVALATGVKPSADLSPGFRMPGLIDVHDHLTSDPKNAGYPSSR